MESNGTYEAVNLTGSISTKPEEGSYMAMSRVKTPFRKTKGDAKKILKAFETFFPRLKKLVNDNRDNIYKVEEIKDKYFK